MEKKSQMEFSVEKKQKISYTISLDVNEEEYALLIGIFWNTYTIPNALYPYPNNGGDREKLIKIMRKTYYTLLRKKIGK